MRILGLDVGSKTVGMAVSDPLGWTAQGIGILSIDEDNQLFKIEEIIRIIHEYQVKKVVIGLPKNMDNSEGFRAEASRHYAELLQAQIDIPIDFQDERLTTVQAERMLISEGNVSRKKRKKVIDKLAAVILLQNYLDRTSSL
ncbi:MULTISPECIES: Holliday junction resolvase RuvX [unclassified Granulicatella]|uniref:Holliday junction resolvase RuvX n=1 Tax=unclassified Granulicatella TaxID=2630493 RepID=UPI0010733DF2|nr:Holliday junction resolvase RuvX [Granulicatella sp. WM01]MBF0780184.1 Holliday junction resolvase RuvX [Granulicatella sp. 19428wC4_WM01]TFU95735.1 Holliday junction resolvase RuvX [Granulicatella sp. WM01]